MYHKGSGGTSRTVGDGPQARISGAMRANWQADALYESRIYGTSRMAQSSMFTRRLRPQRPPSIARGTAIESKHKATRAPTNGGRSAWPSAASNKTNKTLTTPAIGASR